MGEDATTNWLVDRHVRELLAQDIAEVGAFLLARSAEMASSAVGEHQGPLLVQKSVQEVSALLEKIERAEELLMGKKVERLLLLCSSRRYLEQNVKRIDIAKAQCRKPATQRQSLENVKLSDRRSNAEQGQGRAGPR